MWKPSFVTHQQSSHIMTWLLPRICHLFSESGYLLKGFPTSNALNQHGQMSYVQRPIYFFTILSECRVVRNFRSRRRLNWSRRRTISLFDFCKQWGNRRKFTTWWWGVWGSSPRKFCENMPSFGGRFGIQLPIFDQFCMDKCFLDLPDNPTCVCVCVFFVHKWVYVRRHVWYPVHRT